LVESILLELLEELTAGEGCLPARAIGCPGRAGPGGVVAAVTVAVTGAEAVAAVRGAKALAISTRISAATAVPATWNFLI